jgi:hypothetical protein
LIEASHGATDTQNLYPELLKFLYFFGESGDPQQQQGMLAATGCESLSPHVNSHSPAQDFYIGMVKAPASQRQRSIVDFLAGLQRSGFGTEQYRHRSTGRPEAGPGWPLANRLPRVNAVRRNWYRAFELVALAQQFCEASRARDCAALKNVRHELH